MLKNGVEVLQKDDKTTIKYALWEIDVENDWLKEHKDFHEIFARQKDIHEVNFNTPEEKNLIELLEKQGCFEELEKSVYQGKEIYEIFQHVVNVWYSKYYQHPIWEKLLEGCSINQFVSWLIQNYHLSRSAGVTDSRCAIFLPYVELRSTFKQNAIEEYWHCDAFYFVNHPKLKIPRSEIKNYIPLRSSIAFDQQMLQLAEKDPLAYIMVSYFQENSANFFYDCKSFYKTIEDKYGLEGFFRPWEKHLSYDFEYDHGDRYGELFLKFDNTPKETLLKSFKNSAIAVGYLFEAFDEILNQPETSRIMLRQPISINGESSLIPQLLGDEILSKDLVSEKNHLDLCHKVVNSYFKHHLSKLIDSNKLPQILQNKKIVDYMREALSNAAFRGASFSYNHDEILTLGFIAQHLQKHDVDITCIPNKDSEWTALINYMLESSLKPKNLILSFYYLNQLIFIVFNYQLIPNSILKKITNFLSGFNEEPLIYLNHIIPLLENFKKLVCNSNNFCEFDLFKD